MDGVEAAKALDLLIHDLRAPLSVAQGYLRLLRDDQLEAGAERERAWAQTMDALGRIGRLCDDAAAFSDDGVARRPDTLMALPTLLEKVTHACSKKSAGELVFSAPVELTGPLRFAPTERLAGAVAEILWAAYRSVRGQQRRVLVLATTSGVRFLLGGDEDHSALLTRPAEPFDPWRGGHGIALPLACRTVTVDAGGRVWTVAGARGCVGIDFPAETTQP